MSDLLLVVTCPQCGADINWREGVPTDSGLRCVAVGACTECRYEYFARVELGYVTSTAHADDTTAICKGCGRSFDPYLRHSDGLRIGGRRYTCSPECMTRATRNSRSGRWRADAA